MAKTVAIVQSNYIPWKGYFDLINQVDEFILYDDAQYTRRDWRNRNKIKTPAGAVWLTIPVNVTGRYFQKIKDTTISDPRWRDEHWRTIAHNYGRAAHFKSYQDWLGTLYGECREDSLSLVNHRFLTAICDLLGIRTKITWSMDYRLDPEASPTAKLVALCQQAGATSYLSGPAARAYMEEELFTASGIELRYADYSGYPEYRQLFPPFDHYVSVIDLLLNEGPNAPRFMKTMAASHDQLTGVDSGAPKEQRGDG